MKVLCRFCCNYSLKSILPDSNLINSFKRVSSHFKAIKEDLYEPEKTARTHTCGELNSSHIKQNVTLCGWLDFQRMNRFAVLRDGYGSTQIIIPDGRNDLADLLKSIPLESVISVEGVVEKRPDGQLRKDSPTGEVEVVVKDLNVLNAVKGKLPFNIRNYSKASENLRIKHRYLDLRYPEMQRNLRERSRFMMKMRNFLHGEGFVEVETPTLFKKTPGGAQEFIVPTKNPGEFFSLVQSPQQLKQLLMVGSLDKYFQIARCYRDEGARPDRQPEFTQLDLEMSFCSVQNIVDIIERLLTSCWPEPLKTPFKKMSYEDALLYYGTDQPDISFKCLISEVHSLSNRTTGESVFAVKIPQAGIYFTSALKKELLKILKDFSVKVESLNYLSENCEKLQNSLVRLNIDSVRFTKEFSVKPGDIIFAAKGKEKDALLALGKCRSWYLRWLRSNGKTGEWDSEEKGKFLWVHDFPLFEASGDGMAIKSVHHPFTMPYPEDINLLDSDPLQVRGLHYDLVLDGYEVGGGSIRVHDRHLQEKIFSLLQIPSDDLHYLFDALGSGAPPHGGIALGVDRLISLMLGAKTIRDVIAFPKTADGKDPMTGAPSPVSPDELEYYNISVTET